MPTLPKEIDPASSILFLGSGFSRNAKNIRNQQLPIGDDLKRGMAKILNIDPFDYDLKTIADEFASDPKLDLYQFLYETFTVKELDKDQNDLLNLPWRRIYTTNYDDAVEFNYRKRNFKAPSFNYDDAKPRRIAAGSVIHLHGIIRKANKENVLDQLVLNEASYIRQHFEKSPWYDDFDRDLRYCANCFFVGYSLTDYHIAALLMRNQMTKEKTFFITRSQDRIFENRIADYGYPVPIGLEGFTQYARTTPKPSASDDPYALKAFQYLDPFKDKKTLSPPTTNEVLNLVTYGTFNFLRCISTLPAPTYVVPRTERIDEVIAHLGAAKCIIVHSWLGNGKTIFSYIFAAKLAEGGYHCVRYKGDGPLLSSDIDILNKLGKVAIIFDSYNEAVDAVEQFSGLPETAKYVVNVRTGIQEVRLHEIQARLPSPQYRLSLNGLTQTEKKHFVSLLDRSGVRVPNLEKTIERCGDFREVVVALYDNDIIKTKIRKELKPLMQDPHFRKVFVATHLTKWVGQDVPPSFIRSVTGIDAYAEIAKYREITGDMFNLDDESLRLRSAIFSEYIIQNHFVSEDIAELSYEIIVEAVRRKKERRYQGILSSLMQISNLRRALRHDPNWYGTIVGLFERLHRDIEVNREPLFWLQYAILMTDSGELESAEHFMETAYSRAAESPGFRTYQIDTQNLRLLLLLETRSKETPIKRFDQIIETIELILAMMSEESHRTYAIRVLEFVNPFVSARISDLSTPEKNVLTLQINRLIEALEYLDIDVRAQTGSELVKQSLVDAKNIILSAPIP